LSRFKWLNLESSHPAEKDTPPSSADVDAESLETDIADHRHLLQIAEEAYRAMLYEKALKFYSKALGVDPNLEVAWSGQLRCLLDLNENPEALTWATKAQQMFPKSADIISVRALALAREGNIPDALALSDGAMKNDPIGWFSWIARGEILALADSGNSEFCMMKAREMMPNDWLIVLKVAQGYSRTSMKEKSVSLYKKVLSAQPDLAEAWYEMGIIQMDLGLIDDAQKCFERAHKLIPANRKFSNAFSETLQFGFMDKAYNWIKTFFSGAKRK